MKKALVSGIILIAMLFFLFYSCKKDKPTPPVVTTAAVTEIAQTTATAGGNVSDDGGAPISSRGVCYSPSANPTVENPKTTESGSTGSFTSKITQLTANTTYHVRAYATNSEATGYGSDVTFTTSAVAAAELTTASVSSITQTTAVSGGTITSANGEIATAKQQMQLSLHQLPVQEVSSVILLICRLEQFIM